MMYASKAQPDRFPYRVGQVRLAYEGTLNGKPTVHDPRPFDPSMHNEPNPYLMWLREDVELNPEESRDYFIRESLEDMEIEDQFPELASSAPHRDHARRVLSRLANLKEES